MKRGLDHILHAKLLRSWHMWRDLASKGSEACLARESRVVIVQLTIELSVRTIVLGVIMFGVRFCGIRINVLASLFSEKIEVDCRPMNEALGISWPVRVCSLSA